MLLIASTNHSQHITTTTPISTLFVVCAFGWRQLAHPFPSFSLPSFHFDSRSCDCVIHTTLRLLFTVHYSLLPQQCMRVLTHHHPTSEGTANTREQTQTNTTALLASHRWLPTYSPTRTHTSSIPLTAHTSDCIPFHFSANDHSRRV